MSRHITIRGLVSAPIFTAVLTTVLAMTAPAMADGIRFGDNKSKWANDNECDDRRFYGTGMAKELDSDDIGHDAKDCRGQFNLGTIKLWQESSARAATQCSAIKFGRDNSKWANDDECDDGRFEGRGSSDVVLRDDIGKDATDCRAACRNGTVFLRNY